MVRSGQGRGGCPPSPLTVIRKISAFFTTPLETFCKEDVLSGPPLRFFRICSLLLLFVSFCSFLPILLLFAHFDPFARLTPFCAFFVVANFCSFSHIFANFCSLGNAWNYLNNTWAPLELSATWAILGYYLSNVWAILERYLRAT